MALIVVGVLLALSIYFDLAGPVGRGIETLFGWFVGLGRFLLPPALVAIGVSMVRRGQSSSPVRLVVGWAVVVLSALGLLHLLRGPEREDHILYSSHTVWRSKAEFEAWTKSEQFRKAHANAGSSSIRPMYLGHPEFEGFAVVQEVDSKGNKRLLSQDAA